MGHRHFLRVTAHSPQLVGAVVPPGPGSGRRGSKELGQGPHGGALHQRTHDSIGQGFKPGAAGGHRSGLQVGAGDAGMGGQ